MKQWKPGAVRLATEVLRQAVAGKKIALMMNTSAIDNEGRLLVDVMVQEKWTEIAFFMGMEHGVRGNLYASHGDTAEVDEPTGVKIVSLYQFPGACPTPELCSQVDAVVFCAQDVGVRHWTYTPWMMKLMDACAKVGTEVIVLDRPNPIRGDIVEGAPAETKYAGTHLISGFEYPLRHGMTIGELALMYNDVKKVGAKLTVLKMEGWKRDMWFEDTGLIWTPPSPNMPTVDTALYFAATGLMQSGNFSLGHGTPTPFQYVGRPDVSGQAIADALNELDLPGIYFVPKFYMSRFGGDMQLCDGVIMVIHDRNAWRPVHTQLNMMATFAKLYPDIYDPEASPKYARSRMCTDKICDAIKNKESLQPVMDEWIEGAKLFEEQRKPYLLY